MGDQWKKRPMMGNAFAREIPREDSETLSALDEYHEFLRSPTPNSAKAPTKEVAKSKAKGLARKLQFVPAAFPSAAGRLGGARHGSDGYGTVTEPHIPSPLRVPAKGGSGWPVRADTKPFEAPSTKSFDEAGRAQSAQDSPSNPTPTTSTSPWSMASEETPAHVDAPPSANVRNLDATPFASQLTVDARQIKLTPVTLTSLPPKSQLIDDGKRDDAASSETLHANERPIREKGPASTRPGAMMSRDGNTPPTLEVKVGRREAIPVLQAPTVTSIRGVIGHANQLDLLASPSSVYSDTPSAQVVGATDPNDDLRRMLNVPLSQNSRPPMPAKATFRHALEEGHAHSHMRKSSAVKITKPADYKPPRLTPTSAEKSSGPAKFTDPTPLLPKFTRDQVQHPNDTSFLDAILSIHHHLTSETRQLSHSIATNHDQLKDQLLRRLENFTATPSKQILDLSTRIGGLEQGLARAESTIQGLGGRLDTTLRAQHNELRSALHRLDQNQVMLQSLLETITNRADDTNHRLDDLKSRLATLEIQVHAGACRCRHASGNVGIPPTTTAARNAFAAHHAAMRMGAGPDIRDHPAFRANQVGLGPPSRPPSRMQHQQQQYPSSGYSQSSQAHGHSHGHSHGMGFCSYGNGSGNASSVDAGSIPVADDSWYQYATMRAPGSG